MKRGASKKQSIYRFSTAVHKWGGLILALQILFWIGGGLIMSAIPLEKVHGKHLAKFTIENTHKTAHTYSLDKLLSTMNTTSEIQLAHRLETPIYIVSSNAGKHIYHGQTGTPIQPLQQSDVENLASQYYLGEGQLSRATLLISAPHEASRAKGEVWQVQFNDTWNTTLYINPNSGALIHIRSDIWRIFDFVWMLHIMDYDTRDDFNNPLLISFAAASLLFTLSGFVLLYRTYSPQLKRARKKIRDG